MTDAMEFDNEELDPSFVKSCAQQAEKTLWNYANNPKANPMMSQMIGLFLNRHAMMLGMLKGVVDIHNGIVDKHRSSADANVPTDVSIQLNDLALLATACATNFGDEIAHMVVRFMPEAGRIEFDNIAGQGVRPEAPEPDAEIDPLLAAHDKGLH